jgi:hypothetical protein
MRCKNKQIQLGAPMKKLTTTVEMTLRGGKRRTDFQDMQFLFYVTLCFIATLNLCYYVF